MIVLDASAAIDFVLKKTGAQAIGADLVREGPVVMPANLEAESYAGLRRMALHGDIERSDVARAIDALIEMPGERVPIAALLTAAYGLFDNVGAHDAFYVVLARLHDAPLLTSDAHLAAAAEALGVTVLLRQSQ